MSATKAKWIALTSRTGSTLREVISRSGVEPADTFSATTRREHNKLMQMLRDNAKQYFGYFITLNGYMWIIPKDICEMYMIFNLHPAPIHLPGNDWLKGKDPIERSFVERNIVKQDADGTVYYQQGSVIHLVTAGVDEGKQVLAADFLSTNIEDTYKQSFITNVNLWLHFLSNAPLERAETPELY